MTPPLRVWICTQCCEMPGTPDENACIVIRQCYPDDRLDAGCPWCGVYAIWHAVNDVHFEPPALLHIASTLSGATTDLIGDAIHYLKKMAEVDA